MERRIVIAIATPSFLAMSFPERLVEIRKSRQLTQHALADLAGIHLTQVQRYEKGEAQPTLDMIRKLSKALAVSADWLLFDEEERGPDDTLKRHFEAIRQFDEEDRRVVEDVLESLILKHQAKQVVLRSQLAAAPAHDKRQSARPRRSGTR